LDVNEAVLHVFQRELGPVNLGHTIFQNFPLSVLLLDRTANVEVLVNPKEHVAELPKQEEQALLCVLQMLFMIFKQSPEVVIFNGG
jgi:hypothetical protein